jgi:hypothetical protein
VAHSQGHQRRRREVEDEQDGEFELRPGASPDGVEAVAL